MSGLGDKLKGTAEEMMGKVTGDQELEAKGKTEQIVGNLKDRADDTKEEIGTKVNEVLDKVKDTTKDDNKNNQA